MKIAEHRRRVHQVNNSSELPLHSTLHKLGQPLVYNCAIEFHSGNGNARFGTNFPFTEHNSAPVSATRQLPSYVNHSSKPELASIRKRDDPWIPHLSFLWPQ